jgi:hypothetical protein
VVAERGAGSPEGLSMVEGINSGGKTSTSWRRGHQRGPSGWGGSTRQSDAWGGVEAIGEGLERAVRGGSVMASMTSQWR